MSKVTEKEIIDTTMEEVNETVETTEEEAVAENEVTEVTEEKTGFWSEVGFCLRHPIKGAKKHPVAMAGAGIALGVTVFEICKLITGRKTEIDLPEVDMIPLDNVDIPEVETEA